MARSQLGLSDQEYRAMTPRVFFSMVRAYGEIKTGKKVEKKEDIKKRNQDIFDGF